MSDHPRCEGKDRLECLCWRAGAREEAAFHTLRPATRELTEYIRAVGDSDPAMNTSDMADRVYAVFHEPRTYLAPTPPDALREALEDLTGVAAATLPLVSPSHPLRQAVANARAALEEADRD